MSEQSNFNLDKNTAENLLNSVLDSCNIPPSPKSLDNLMLERAIERKPISISKWIALIFIIIAICSPLAFRGDPGFNIVTGSKTVAVTSHTLYDSCFVLTLSGDADYKNIQSKKEDGTIIFPDTADETTGVVIFPYNGEALNIYIPTESGECIQAVLHESK